MRLISPTLAVLLGVYLFTAFVSATPTIPTGISYYIPINVINSQTAATSGNFQQMVSFNTLAICNATLCAPHLNNTEFFYYNGTLIPSWYESASGMSTNYASNDFASSSNVIAWVRFAAANFIPASGSNTIYLGFAANTASEFSNSITGEAPQLTASYALYDNGASVFSYYQRWGGLSAVPSSWTNTGLSPVFNSNSINLWATTGGTAGALVLPSPVTTYPAILDNYITFYQPNPDSNDGFIGYSSSSTPIPIALNSNMSALMISGYGGASATVLGVSASSATTANTNISPPDAVTIISIESISTTSANYLLNYTSFFIEAYAGTLAYIQLGTSYASSSTSDPMQLFWTRIRAYPPSGVMPSLTFGAVIPASTYTPPTITRPTISNAIADVGQTETISATITGGTPDYAGNFLISNSIPSLTQTLAVPSQSSTALSSSWTATANEIGNGNTGNFVGTDSHPTAFNSIPSAAFTVNPALLSDGFTASNGIIDTGQYEIFTASVSGGTSPYTYNFLVYNAIGSLVYNSLYSGISSTSNAVTFQILSAWGTGTFTANITTTDSASTPTSTTNTLTYIVNNALVAGAPTPNNLVLDNGQSGVIDFHPSGGTTPYSYDLYGLAGSTTPTCTSSDYITNPSEPLQTISPTQTTTYAYSVTDSATTHSTVCSSDVTVKVNPTQIADSWTTSNSPIDTGQIQVLTTDISGGTSPYTYNFLVYSALGNLVANNLVTNSLTTNSFAFVENSLWGTGTFTANIITTDSATTPTSTTNTLTYTTNSSLIAAEPSASNTAIDNGQYSQLNVTAGGGLGQYVYQWYYGTSPSCSSDTSAGPATANYLISPSSTTYYCYKVTDSKSPSVSVYSTARPVVVYPTPTVTDITPSNTVLNSGQTVVYNAIISGGSYPANVAQFNGASSNILTDLVHPYADAQGSTFAAWIDPYYLSSSTYGAVIFGYQGWLNDHNNKLYYYTNENGNFGGGNLTENKWAFVTATITTDVNPTITLYVNGQDVGSNTITGITGSGGCQNSTENVIMGEHSGTCGAYNSTIPWNGLIANAQVYNATLTPAQVNALYNEGIGGAPLPENNTGWWRLNGTSNGNIVDYSGQNNNGAPTNIIFPATANSPYGPYTVNLINTVSGEANSLTGQDNGIITFGADVPSSGTQTFYVAANDAGVTTPFAFNSVLNTITINSASTSSDSGSGGPSNRMVLITDNINATASSAVPIVSITVSGVKTAYYQNEFPIQLTTTAPSINVSFACSVQIGNDRYSFQNDISGIGFGVNCAKWYTSYTDSIEGTYALNNTIAHASKTNSSTNTVTENSTKPTTTKNILKSSITRISDTEVAVCSNASDLAHNLAYRGQGASFRIIQAGNGCYNFTSVNVTRQKIANASLPDKTEILALNITANSPNVLINATIDYPCNLPSGSVSPYLLKNEAWVPITPFTVNAASCTITFDVPQDPIVAVMENTTQSTNNLTILNISTPPSTTSPSATSAKVNTNQAAEEVSIVIIIIILIAAYLTVRRLRKEKRIFK